ncbi:MAG: hypothetical protein WC876_03600 [Candidatus Thermoplasmatota archaeon]|jgi:predicted transcriptional regulator
MRQPRRQALLELVAARPGICLSDLAGELGVSTSSIEWHYQVLHSLSMLEARREGIHRCFFLGSRAARWLRQHQRST